MPTNSPRRVLRHLRALYDPQALCFGLQKILLEQQQPCAHDFTHTRALFARYAPDIDVPAYLALLGDLGAHCDCEVIQNVCPSAY